jgi:hypothetical protein
MRSATTQEKGLEKKTLPYIISPSNPKYPSHPVLVFVENKKN